MLESHRPAIYRLDRTLNISAKGLQFGKQLRRECADTKIANPRSNEKPPLDESAARRECNKIRRFVDHLIPRFDLTSMLNGRFSTKLEARFHARRLRCNGARCKNDGAPISHNLKYRRTMPDKVTLRHVAILPRGRTHRISSPRSDSICDSRTVTTAIVLPTALNTSNS